MLNVDLALLSVSNTDTFLLNRFRGSFLVRANGQFMLAVRFMQDSRSEVDERGRETIEEGDKFEAMLFRCSVYHRHGCDTYSKAHLHVSRRVGHLSNGSSCREYAPAKGILTGKRRPR